MNKEQAEKWIKRWVVFNAVLMIGFTIAWPVTAFTIFRAEQQGILGLSYIAIIVGAMGNLIAVLVLMKVQ